MPDCRISRVRFEALAFPLWTFPTWRGSSAGSHPPRLPWFAHSLVSTADNDIAPALSLAAALLDETAKCPESLCLTTDSSRQGGLYIPSCEDITPRSSLLRTHSPIPFGSSFLRPWPRARSLCRLLPAPAATGSSRRYLCESFLGCPVPCHGGPAECIYLFLPPRHRPSPTEAWVGFPLIPANTTFHGSVFRGCRHFVMFRPPSLLVSQIVPTAVQTDTGQPRLLRPGKTCFVTSARTGYASRPNTGN